MTDWDALLKICRRLKRKLVREVQGFLSDFVATNVLVIFRALAIFVAPIAVLTVKRTII